MKQNKTDADSGASLSDGGLESIFPITKFDHPDLAGGIVWSDCELAWINGRITWAILAEREACAAIADKYTCGTCGMDGKAGREIRERSNLN